jgi:hypothetical protein
MGLGEIPLERGRLNFGQGQKGKDLPVPFEGLLVYREDLAALGENFFSQLFDFPRNVP